MLSWKPEVSTLRPVTGDWCDVGLPRDHKNNQILDISHLLHREGIGFRALLVMIGLSDRTPQNDKATCVLGG